jgi:hypothetical protein
MPPFHSPHDQDSSAEEWLADLLANELGDPTLRLPPSSDPVLDNDLPFEAMDITTRPHIDVSEIDALLEQLDQPVMPSTFSTSRAPYEIALPPAQPYVPPPPRPAHNPLIESAAWVLGAAAVAGSLFAMRGDFSLLKRPTVPTTGDPGIAALQVNGPAVTPAEASCPNTRPDIPVLAYEKMTKRALLFVNNPEELHAHDLGDAAHGKKSLYRDVLEIGKFRIFSEHTNTTPADLGVGVRLTNPTSSPITIIRQGEAKELTLDGGKSAAALLNHDGKAIETVVIPPGEQRWIVSVQGIKPKHFFSVLADFEVKNGNPVLELIAFQNQNDVPREVQYMGFIDRVNPDKSNEFLVYKGRADASEVVTQPLRFTIDDSTTGSLPIQHRTWDASQERLGDCPEVKPGGWFTHIGPNPTHNPRAALADLVTFFTPIPGKPNELLVFDPLKPQPGSELKFPNVANWAVVHTTVGEVENRGTKPRTVTLRITSQGGDMRLAYFSSSSDPKATSHLTWTPLTLENKNDGVDTLRFVVPPGQKVAFRESIMLAAPSAGNMLHEISVDGGARQIR